MATKQTRKTTSAKRPAKPTAKATAKGRKTTRTTARKAEPKIQKKNEYAYVLPGIWTVLAGVLLGIFTYGSGQGVVAGFINDAMFGLFSLTAYFVPIVILAIGIYVFRVRRTNNLTMKILLSILAVVLVGALVMLFWQEKMPEISALWGYGIENIGGGILGGTIAILLKNLFGKAASVVIILVLLAIDLCFVFRVSFTEIFENISKEREEYDEMMSRHIVLPEKS